jgi:hypothetical protein
LYATFLTSGVRRLPYRSCLRSIITLRRISEGRPDGTERRPPGAQSSPQCALLRRSPSSPLAEKSFCLVPSSMELPPPSGVPPHIYHKKPVAVPSTVHGLPSYENPRTTADYLLNNHPHPHTFYFIRINLTFHSFHVTIFLSIYTARHERDPGIDLFENFHLATEEVLVTNETIKSMRGVGGWGGGSTLHACWATCWA